VLGQTGGQIVPYQGLEDLARDQGEDAVTDARLYNDLIQEHYIRPFGEFCSECGFGLLVTPLNGADPDWSRYVRQQVLRREALNLFIRQMPHVVIHEKRCFRIRFPEEPYTRIDEFTTAELAEFANAVPGRKESTSEKLQTWYRTRCLRRNINSARLGA
jgi:hypothetical protein